MSLTQSRTQSVRWDGLFCQKLIYVRDISGIFQTIWKQISGISSIFLAYISHISGLSHAYIWVISEGYLRHSSGKSQENIDHMLRITFFLHWLRLRGFSTLENLSHIFSFILHVGLVTPAAGSHILVSWEHWTMLRRLTAFNTKVVAQFGPPSVKSVKVKSR